MRHGAVMECSRIPLWKWAIATYSLATILKGISSLKLRLGLGITQMKEGFRSVVARSILAANVHRMDLLTQRAARADATKCRDLQRGVGRWIKATWRGGMHGGLDCELGFAGRRCALRTAAMRDSSCSRNAEPKILQSQADSPLTS